VSTSITSSSRNSVNGTETYPAVRFLSKLIAVAVRPGWTLSSMLSDFPGCSTALGGVNKTT
jgi:hypothetical protein